jgi:hypothetical protein
MKRLLSFVLFVLSIAWALAPAQAQSFTRNIVGTVKNANGEVIPNAEITVTQTQTNKVFTLTTNDEGYYSSPPLTVGDYRVEALNAFNTPRFGSPNTSVTSTTFGQITSQANAPRQLQFALKLLW